MPALRDWLRSADIRVESTKAWEATLQVGDHTESFGFADTDGAGPRMPGNALPTLNRLGREGWRRLGLR